MFNVVRQVIGAPGRFATLHRASSQQHCAGLQPRSARRVHARSSDRDVNPVAARRSLQAYLGSPLEFSIAGVSFGNRQDVVKQLQPGQGIVFLKEPNNPYDPAAVAIETTTGAALGYVPRTLTHLFEHEYVVGRVLSQGRNSSVNLHGAFVHVWPSLPGITLQQLPVSLWQQGCADLEALLTATQFAALQTEVLEAARQRCEVTGLDSRRSTLNISPVWRLDYDRQVAVLVHCLAVCGPVYAAERLLDPRSAAVDQHPAARLMQEVNLWRQVDVEAYVEHAGQLQQQLKIDGSPVWRYDISRVAGHQAT